MNKIKIYKPGQLITINNHLYRICSNTECITFAGCIQCIFANKCIRFDNYLLARICSKHWSYYFKLIK